MNYTLMLQAVLLIFAIVGIITVFTAIMFYIEKLLSDREERKKNGK